MRRELAWRAFAPIFPFILVLCSLHLAASAPIAVEQIEGQRRVIAVGDLHGDFRQTASILADLGLRDASGSWIGGRDILVQLGDVVDRGDDARSIYEALFRLQDEAPTTGGEVILLLGNHELLNMQGDFRYASAVDTERFGGNRTQAFGREGWPGKELRRRAKAVARLGLAHGLLQPVLFSHAGVLPAVAKSFDSATSVADGDADVGQRAVDALNSHVHEHLTSNSKDWSADASILLGRSGPFWTRHLTTSPDVGAVCGDLEESLRVFGATRMVVGHTVQENAKVNHRCSGRLVIADTGISEAVSGTPHPSSVELGSTGYAFALYPATRAGRQPMLRGGATLRERLPTVKNLPVAVANPPLRWSLVALGFSVDTTVATLQLPTKADARRAFKRLSIIHHPDRGGSQQAFQELTSAYERLAEAIASTEFHYA